MVLITRINDLIRPISTEQRRWLEKLLSDSRPAVRVAAREVLEED